MTSALVTAAEGTNPLIPAAGELIIGTIAFGLLCFVLLRTVFPRAEQLYRERRDKIEGGIERAERLQQEARQALEQYRAQLAEARSDAGRIREQAHEDGRRIRDELRAQAEAERVERRQRFDEQLAAERAQAVASLRREVGALALTLAERVVGHELSHDDRQRELVDDFIAGLEAAPSAEDAATPASAGS